MYAGKRWFPCREGAKRAVSKKRTSVVMQHGCAFGCRYVLFCVFFSKLQPFSMLFQRYRFLVIWPSADIFMLPFIVFAFAAIACQPCETPGMQSVVTSAENSKALRAVNM